MQQEKNNSREESVRHLINLVYYEKNKAAIELYDAIQIWCPEVFIYTKKMPKWKKDVYNIQVERSKLSKEEKDKLFIG